MRKLLKSLTLGLYASGVFVGVGCAEEEARTAQSSDGALHVEVFAGPLEHPWSIEFLPDGRMLVSERPGRLRIVSRTGTLSKPLAGLPAIFAEGQGGLLDLALAPDFTTSHLIYFSFSEPRGDLASTAVARARLGTGRLDDVTVIFRQVPKVEGGNHFGSRLQFGKDGKLYITTGERFLFSPAQKLSNHLGKILRVNPDGSVPADNPFVNRHGAKAEIWSYGHRNVQGIALQPQSGALWTVEMGPRGGDELNIIRKGANYGWPLVSWGEHYDGADIPRHTTRPDFAAPVRHWTPVISPSGIAFYTGALFPGWKNNLLLAGLNSEMLVRLVLKGNQVVSEERISLNARIRDVKQGPDGAVYVITDEDDGAILKLTPAKN